MLFKILIILQCLLYSFSSDIKGPNDDVTILAPEFFHEPPDLDSSINNIHGEKLMKGDTSKNTAFSKIIKIPSLGGKKLSVFDKTDVKILKNDVIREDIDLAKESQKINKVNEMGLKHPESKYAYHGGTNVSSFGNYYDLGAKEQKFDVLKRSLTPIHMVYEKHECKYGHNKLRILYQAKSLEWHEQLAYSCEKYALHLATQNKGAQHSSFYDNQGRKYGENLYWYKGSDQKDCHEAIFLWYQEHTGYKHEKPSNLYASGHFIQLVWEETRYLGVGIAYAHDQTWIVARYFPASNTAVEKIGNYVKKPLYAEAKIAAKDLIALRPRPKWVQVVYVTPNIGSDCTDTNIYCSYYKQIGYCSQKSIQKSCPIACGRCNSGPPVNGHFTEWVKAETCSSDCGTGTLVQHRYCANPEPMNGGAKCAGATSRTLKCEDHSCPNRNMNCADQHRDCVGYARKGYCTSNVYKAFMERMCKTSCGICQRCHDNYDNKKCTYYGREMKLCYNKKYMPFMKKNCQQFCCEQSRFFLYSGEELRNKFVTN